MDAAAPQPETLKIGASIAPPTPGVNYYENRENY
jgi:hypothetical protein